MGYDAICIFVLIIDTQDQVIYHQTEDFPTHTIKLGSINVTQDQVITSKVRTFLHTL
jgi:hypothetical protein